MAILTSFEINVEIDDKSYTIVAGGLDKRREKEIEQKRKERIDLDRKREELVSKVQLNGAEYQANETLMKNMKITERGELAGEQKRFVRENREAAAQIRALDEQIAKIRAEGDVESRMRFDGMVEEGEGKRELVKCVETTSLTYAVLVTEILTLIAKEKEKK